MTPRRRSAAGFLLRLTPLILLAVVGCGRGGAWLKTAAAPADLAVDPRGRWLFVACEEEQVLQAWDLKRRAVRATAGIGPGPHRLYVDRVRSAVVVLCEVQNQVRRFRMPDLESAGSLTLPDGPSAWTRLPEESWEAVASANGGTVRPFRDEHPLADWDGGPSPRDLVCLPERRQLWVLNRPGHRLTALHLEQGRILGQVPTWPNPLRLYTTPVGDRLLVVCRGEANATDGSAGMAQWVDPTYRRAGLRWSVGTGVREAAYDPMGRYLAVLNDQGLQQYDLATGLLLDTIPLGREPQAVALSPDGTRIFVSLKDRNGVRMFRIRPEQRTP